MDNFTRKMAADRILYEFGLMEQLEKIGIPHIIGSYRMDMMAWNDLDIDIENDNMSKEKLYELSAYIFKTFQPLWYEAKEEISEDGKRVWFHWASPDCSITWDESSKTIQFPNPVPVAFRSTARG